jgi:signal recognition particle subunit SRP54
LLAKTPSRRRRIAKGCGRTESEVNKLIADFTRMRTMMQQMTSGNFPGMPGMPGMGGMGGGGMKKPKKKKKGFGTL